MTRIVMRCVLKSPVAALLATLLLGCAATDHDDQLKKEQRTVETALNKRVIPNILAALTSEHRLQLGPVRTEVMNSIDAAQIVLEDDTRKGSRLVVTTSFLAAQNALLDASVIASATTGHERQLVDYSVIVARFAVGGSSSRYSEPFWHYIGWTAEQYDVFSSEPRFQALRERVLVQSLAWLVALLMNERLDTNVETELDVLQSGNSMRQRTADPLLRAQIAPVPAWPVATLFAATRKPDEQASAQWICAARDVLESAITAAERYDFPANDRLSIASRDAALSRWRFTSQTLLWVAECDSSSSASGARPFGQQSQ